MENAIKALTMAASVLISLVIIGAVLLVFNNLRNYQNVNDQLTRDAHVIEFNNRFETYNRTDVRGSDIVSLMNKILDYNERESSSGVEGSDKGYEPITLTINLSSENPDDLEKLYLSGGPYLIKFYQYTVPNNNSESDENDLEYVLSEVNEIEKEYGQANLTRMINNITSIFIDETSTDEEEQAKAVEKCNSLVDGMNVTDWSQIDEDSAIRKAVYQYYEYIQFKRLHFDCSTNNRKDSGVEYDENTGRIISMSFESNGKIE